MSRDLLIEIGTEDLPARFVAPLSQALADGITEGLKARQLGFARAKAFATPRRIAIWLQQLDEQQADQSVERKGPAVAAAFKDGVATKAAEGFARSCGVTVDELERIDTPKGEWLVYRATEAGRATAELIPEIFAEALKRMDQLVPKRMRWGSGDETFVRPVLWLLALWGEDVLPLQAYGLQAGNRTLGHRFHAPDHIVITEPAQYEEQLQTAHVWSDFESRRDEIRRQIEAKAAEIGGAARIDADLLDEVTSLVEWPVVIAGKIEPRFLELPPEVLIATIEQHQRYFPIRDASGALMPAFITVSNIESKDVAQVITGNERVVTPRLADAMFFWEQDREQPLGSFVDKLDRVTFQKELGSTGAKVLRTVKLAQQLASALKADATTVEHAARLAKADLQTTMVFEFPELQGLMGGYYARAAGESEAVAQAIAEHYFPVGAGAPIPGSREGQIVALADKLDTLCGIFAIGQAPTGSKDPFALRRAALGVLRILIEGELNLNLVDTVRASLQAQPCGQRDEAMTRQICEFLWERLRGVLDAPAEVYNAVVASGSPSPLDLAERAAAVQGFLQLPESAALAAAHKRVRNILKQESGERATVKSSLFESAAETQLFEALQNIRDTVEYKATEGEYGPALKTMAQLQKPVDAFFDQVMVMADDPAVRNNRIALLQQLDELCRSVADISCLPG